jgi:hypothetical protein
MTGSPIFEAEVEMAIIRTSWTYSRSTSSVSSYIPIRMVCWKTIKPYPKLSEVMVSPLYNIPHPQGVHAD